MKSNLNRRKLLVAAAAASISVGLGAAVAVGVNGHSDNAQAANSQVINATVPPDAPSLSGFRVAFPTAQNDNIINLQATSAPGQIALPLAYKCDPPQNAVVRMCGGAQERGHASIYTGRVAASVKQVFVKWTDGTTTHTTVVSDIFVVTSDVPAAGRYGPAAEVFTALDETGARTGEMINPAAHEAMPSDVAP